MNWTVVKYQPLNCKGSIFAELTHFQILSDVFIICCILEHLRNNGFLSTIKLFIVSYFYMNAVLVLNLKLAAINLLFSKSLLKH